MMDGCMMNKGMYDMDDMRWNYLHAARWFRVVDRHETLMSIYNRWMSDGI